MASAQPQLDGGLENLISGIQTASARRPNTHARQQHAVASAAAALAAQNTAAKPCAWLKAPPATPPMTPDAP